MKMTFKYLIFTSLIFAIIFNVVTSTPLRLHREQNKHKIPQFKALSDYLLTDNILPIHYQIELYPYILTPADRNFTFDGKVIIDILVNKDDTNEIKLHAYDVTISSITVKKIDDGSLINVDSFTIADDDTNFLTINLASNVIVGSEYQIDIDYVGVLNNDLEGFYRSTYNNANGDQIWMAVTHFQANGARRAFPCFDQPDLKSKFTMSIAREPGQTILANMPVLSEGEPVDKPGLENWEWVHLKTSQPMSTYLIAFSVNQFDSVSSDFDPSLKVWARPEAINQAALANAMAPKAVEFMEQFTHYPFMLEKLDQIAIPDFASGGMENWGLITYRETNLLFEEGKSTSDNRQSVATVVFHEFSHQWFGDLVTPAWWNNLWLSEGFATYFEYFATNQYEPTWKLEEQFIYEQMHTVMNTDASENTHPLVASVDDPSSINGIFDEISYNKGGCIVRMLVTLMGQEEFSTGIENYLTVKSFQAVVPDDVWAGLQTAVPPNLLPSGIDLKTIMDTWALQSGYPVVNVKRDYNTGTASLTQQRFLTLKNPEVSYNESWWVPLTVASASQPNFEDTSVKYWLSEQPLDITDLDVTSDQWIIFNLKQVGFYRVNYDSANWQLFVDTLNDPDMMPSIHLMNRAQLMDDALALARANDLDYNTALDTTAYLAQESEFLPWASALSALGYLNDRLNYEQESRELFEGYMLIRLENIYNLVNGFTVTEDDSHILRLQRALILDWSCLLGHEACNIEASNLFSEWESSSDPDLQNPTDPDLKNVVYCTGMQEGGRTQYDFLFERYEAASNVASEQALIISALGCSSDTALLQEYLYESIAENSRIRAQDARSCLSAVQNNRVGIDLALDFLLGEFDTLKNIYGGFGVFNRVFSSIAAKLNTQEHKQKLEDFYAENESNLESEVKTAVLAAIVTVEETLQWHSAHRETVVTYLRDHQTKDHN